MSVAAAVLALVFEVDLWTVTFHPRTHFSPVSSSMGHSFLRSRSSGCSSLSVDIRIRCSFHKFLSQ